MKLRRCGRVVSSLPATAGGSEAVLVSWLLHIVIESGSVLVTSCSRCGIRRLVSWLLAIEGGIRAV